MNILNCPIPYTDLKHKIKNHLKNKWQRDWNYQVNNRLHRIKPCISAWPSIMPRKTDVIHTCLRIDHSRIMHRHLLIGENEPTCLRCFFSALTIQHILTDCPGLRRMYRHYFNTSSPSLINLLGKKPHNQLINFLRKSNLFYEI